MCGLRNEENLRRDLGRTGSQVHRVLVVVGSRVLDPSYSSGLMKCLLSVL